MPARISVPLSRHPYDVLVESGALSRAGGEIQKLGLGRRGVIVTDEIVRPLYADRLAASLAEAGCETATLTVPAGESSKSLARVEELCDGMIAAGLDRNSFLVALGGGVVGDLAGFAAAVYYRGIPFVQIPTTVVAQVDSAVGGKTGVNARGGKNLIGSFHQPAFVIADPETLGTLPPREFNEGVAEIIKHAAIRDASLLHELSRLAAEDRETLIARNVRIKAEIVGEDEFERLGVRALLNFGHTIGHAIENAAGYGRFLHGEAISLGLVAATRLSVEKAGLPEADAARIFAALQAFSLPVSLPDDISTPALMEALQRDKKFEAGAVRFVLIRALGDAFVSKDVSVRDIEQAIEDLRGGL